MKNSKRQSGFSIFEGLLIIAVCIAIGLSCIGAYHRVRSQRELEKSRQTVRYILTGSTAFLFKHCRDSVATDTVTPEILLNEKLIPAKVLKNPWLKNFQITFQQDPTRIECRAAVTFKVTESRLEEIAMILGADLDSQTQQLIWRTTPEQVMKKISSRLWMLKSGLRQYAKQYEQNNRNHNRCFNLNEATA